MGQYFVATCPDLMEYLKPSALGDGLKAAEIAYSACGTMNALAMMIADVSAPARPADLRAGRTTGRWAGRRAFFLGDYADDGDARTWPWAIPEGEMYHEMHAKGREVGKRLADHIARANGMIRAESITTYRDLKGRTTKIADNIMLSLVMGPDGRLRPDMTGLEGNPYYEDLARKNAERAAAIEPATYEIDADDGQRRLLANLDRREYVDPRKLAEIPTLVGICRGMTKKWDLRGACPDDDIEPPNTLHLLARLLFMPSNFEGASGEWRSDRILLSAERSRKNPTTHEIERSPDWTDVTERMTSRMDRPDWPAYHAVTAGQRYSLRKAA